AEVLQQQQRCAAVHLDFAEIAPRRANRAVSGELAVEPDLALVERHRVHGRVYFRVRGRELRHQRPWRTRLRLVVADSQSSDLPGESKLANGRGLDRRHPRLIQGAGLVQGGGKPLLGDLVSIRWNAHAASS